MNTKTLATRISLIAETAHIFCCGIPMTVAALTAAGQVTGLGLLVAFHDMMHDYEVAILVGSGLLLLLALGLQYLSFRIDCHQAGCTHPHGDCAPKKFRASNMLLIASAIFALNVVLFFTIDHSVHHHDHAAHSHGEADHAGPMPDDHHGHHH